MSIVSKRFRVDISYPFAKSYGQRGALLGRRFLEELTESSNLEELIAALMATAYSPYVSHLSHPLDSVKIEHALRRALVDLHHKYLMLVSDYSALQALYLRYVARNLKAVFKGLAAGKKYEEIAKLVDVHAEELVGMRDVVIKAMSSSSVEEAARSLEGTIFGDALQEAYQIYERTKDQAVFDAELDKVVASHIVNGIEKTRRKDRKYVGELIYPLIERFLVTSILRAKLWGLTPLETRRLVGGIDSRIPQSVVDSMIECKTIDEALNALAVVKSMKVQVPQVKGVEAAAINALEEGYAKLILDRANKAFLSPQSPLASIIASIFLKEREVQNLVAIAVGIEGKVTPSKIAEKII